MGVVISIIHVCMLIQESWLIFFKKNLFSHHLDVMDFQL